MIIWKNNGDLYNGEFRVRLLECIGLGNNMQFVIEMLL